jgi:glycosyltransferase involved in cell wall biosynthesis
MKIGIDIRLIGKKRTGDEVVIFNLVKGLAQLDSNHEFELLTDAKDENVLNEISQQLGIAQKKNFKIVSVPCKNRFAWNFWTLPNYLRKNPVDIYHTQYITPWFVPKTIKIVTIIHDISFNFFPKFIKFSDLLFLRTLIPISIKRADKVVGVSQFTRAEIIEYYKVDPEKVAWIHNAISEDFLSSDVSASRLEKVREKYSLPQKFVLYMGTLQPRKNIPHLIEAFARIKEDDANDLKLVICGNQKAHNYDQRITGTLETYSLGGEVIFPGFIDEQDKAAVFHLAEVFVFPSLYEGFGIPVLEAMSQGVPVLCSDIPSLKEVAAESALYFDLESGEDFAQKLKEICFNKELREQLALKGKERITAFSWLSSARKMLAIYDGLGNN